ncbi:acyl-CoA thioesterase [Metapseudomonas otitidis]|uniref:acyl-CoA thioesterase n=1 Tax=Metapseudomonas otitidis TaxID=319939 RepID=UPI0013F5EAC1|nr:thioesterase family protein [Pseudomonas otitidis]
MPPPPDRNAFTFFHPLRVRWAEVDPQGIVFNGHYLTYADVAITEYFRAMGVRYPQDLIADGGDFFAVRTLLEYLSPARFDDDLTLGIRTRRLGGSSLTFALGIWRGEEALTSGEIVYVHADATTRASRSLPDCLREKVRDFERCAAEE